MSEGWADAALALRLLALDPAGLGGLHLRARAGPVRQAFEDALAIVPLPLRRLHPGMGADALDGGLDVAATLAERRPVRRDGCLAAPALLLLPMAERAAPLLASRLARALDTRRGAALILLDEGAEDETAQSGLVDRLAFTIDLHAVRWQDVAPVAAVPDPPTAEPAMPPEACRAMGLAAATFGIASPRGPLFALRAARAHALLHGRAEVRDEDLAVAARLVLAPRATLRPVSETPPSEPEARPEQGPERSADTDGTALPDRLVAAIRAALPPGALPQADRHAAPGKGASSGSGARMPGQRRGRPLPARAGRAGDGRIDLFATLTAAAPWQALRRRGMAPDDRVLIRPEDLRQRRHEDRADRLLVFVVDASGSAAVARLAEAKGAVVSLLAEAYAHRDQVALVSFRGAGAELLLPPTRALVRAKRQLAALPGGGGTPLASGLRAALEVAAAGRRRGMDPTLVLLTDGRANVGLDGTGGRGAAMADAEAMARQARDAAPAGLVIDTAPRATPETERLAGLMGARRLALPRARADAIGAAIAASRAG
ncbi:VWA domain-containing protein [Limimaricola pyoseonensis]|uniref:Magnesium chelatase subunit D n=1 Tax=Limimaricola pyoseonensis TaxID=521013 RepID=A0A1G7B1P9_9RHOB|nr:VWA domain-containing protein [Limimaricola pyoseonensis]SDE21019.1 magnesium chelatase subunit D [Limimaricola pyoseonensis]